MDATIFQGKMNMRFADGLLYKPSLIPFAAYTEEVPSDKRIENYPFIQLPGQMQEFSGKMPWGHTQPNKYSLENKEYRVGEEYITTDLEDAMGNATVNLYLRSAEQLGWRAGEEFKAWLTIAKGLALARTAAVPTFDGTNFFATSHNIGGVWTANGTLPATPNSLFGGGGNLLTYAVPAPNADSTFHRFIMLLTAIPYTKPILLQNRTPGELYDTMGTSNAKLINKTHFWARARAGIGGTWWFTGIEVDITGSPQLIDVFNCVDGARQQLQSFIYPQKYPNDAPDFIHGSWMPEVDNTMIICDPSLGEMMQRIVTAPRFGVTPISNTQTTGVTDNDIYRGKFKLMVTPWLRSAS